jgi:ribosomal protein S18 acetylase RimI-like enzyme
VVISHPQPIGVIWRLAAPAQPRALAPTVPTRFGWVRPEEAAALAQAAGGAAASQVAPRLAAGRRCCAAWVSGQPAAWGWVSYETEHVGELGLQLHLRAGEAYIWDCATVPEYRRRGLYAALLAHMARALLAEGVQTIWIGADYNNAPSQAGIGSAGFSAVAEIAAAPPPAGQRRQLAQLVARPGVSPQVLADAGRVYFDGHAAVWLFEAGA